MIYNKKEDLMTALQAVIGESTEQTALDLIANISDTYDSLGSDLQSQLTEANNRYNQLASDYKKRFFSGDPQPHIDPDKKDESDKTLTQILRGV